MKVDISGYNTLVPYKEIEYNGLQYSFCRDFDHLSRYKNLRQVIHGPDDVDRCMTLETPNPLKSNVDVDYYEVLATEENRLDVIASKTLGSPRYAWVIAYFNTIDDGFTVKEGQKLMIPKNVSSLFSSGEILSSIPVTTLHLGIE